ncbi:MAG TPA: gliding motility-associated C-terminal domain-containing protein, partial [Cyclobacteriaceae bacterium]|nr:gliding motility-associated C-terminal domain-containing protein [Cyclobacteriaceae bacterium]
SQSFGLSSAPPGSATAAPITFCDPETVQVTSAMTFPLNYSVTNNGTGAVTGPTLAATSPFNLSAPLTAGTYTIQLTEPGPGGCVFTINNFVIAPAAPLAMTVTPSVCNPASPTITASGAATGYLWSGPGTIVGPSNIATIQVSGLGPATYTVVGSGGVGTCPNSQTITVELDNPAVNFTQSDPCQNSVVLSATPAGNYTYRWLQGVAQVGLGQFLAIGLPENGQSYQVEARNTLNGCTYTSNPPKVAQVTGIVDSGLTSTPACDDNKPFTLTAVTSASGVSYAWFLNNTIIAGQTASTTSQTNAGTYKVEISKSTCKSTSQISITKAPLPVGKLRDREIICNDPENKDPKTNQVDLDPGKFSAYDWYKNDLSINYTAQIYTTTSQGKFRVDLTNSFGCIASDFTEVRNECLPKIDAPNAFRPSSSLTENKEFAIFTFFITSDNFQIFIYNRWGELVYTSTDRYFKWNGGLNNSLSQPLPGGSYAYVIKYVSSFHPERGTQEQRGGVALLR